MTAPVEDATGPDRPGAEGEPAGARPRWVVPAVLWALAAVTVGAGVSLAAGHDGSAPTATGVPAAAAGCQAVLTDPTSPTGQHIGPGSDNPDRTVVYPTVPPSSGVHYITPLYPNVPFYTVRDAPRVEQLVHNLEHGYTIVWYLPTTSAGQQRQLRGVAVQLRSDPATPKVVVAPWDVSRGTFPAGATYVLSHWGSTVGSREFCTTVSGDAIEQFVLAHPYTDSPEPSGA